MFFTVGALTDCPSLLTQFPLHRDGLPSLLLNPLTQYGWFHLLWHSIHTKVCGCAQRWWMVVFSPILHGWQSCCALSEVSLWLCVYIYVYAPLGVCGLHHVHNVHVNCLSLTYYLNTATKQPSQPSSNFVCALNHWQDYSRILLFCCHGTTLYSGKCAVC